MDFCQDIITLINENQAKQTTIFSEGYEGYVLDYLSVLTGLSPRQIGSFYDPKARTKTLERCLCSDGQLYYSHLGRSTESPQKKKGGNNILVPLFAGFLTQRTLMVTT